MARAKLVRETIILGVIILLIFNNMRQKMWINLLRLHTLVTLVDPSAKQYLTPIASGTPMLRFGGDISCASFRVILEGRPVRSISSDLPSFTSLECVESLRRWYRLQAWNPYLSSADHERFVQILAVLSNYNDDHDVAVKSDMGEAVRTISGSHSIMRLIDLAYYYEQKKENEQLAKIKAQMRMWQPRFRATNPRISRYGEEFLFEGFDADPWDIENNPDVEVILVWKTGALQDHRQNWWSLPDNRWVEVVKVRNLIADPGFEWSMVDSHSMVFTQEVYPASQSRGLIEAGEGWNGDITRYLAISAGKDVMSSGLASMRFTVMPGKIYLQGGAIRSDGDGKGYLGRRCLGAVSDGKPPYSYAAQAVTEKTWQGYAGIFVPEAGQRTCEVWLLNTGTGVVMFDYVMFAVLPID